MDHGMLYFSFFVATIVLLCCFFSRWLFAFGGCTASSSVDKWCEFDGDRLSVSVLLHVDIDSSPSVDSVQWALKRVVAQKTCPRPKEEVGQCTRKPTRQRFSTFFSGRPKNGCA